MINSLTEQQKMRMSEYKNECYKKGISCESINKKKLIDSISKLYQKNFLKKPRFLFFDSIYSCQIAMNLLVQLGSAPQIVISDMDSNEEKIKLKVSWKELKESFLNQIMIYPEIIQMLYSKEEKNKNVSKMLDNKMQEVIIKGIEYFSCYFWGQQGYYWVSFYRFCREIGVKYPLQQDEMLDIWTDIADYGHWWWATKSICILSERPIKMLFEGNKLHAMNEAAVQYKDGYKQYFINGINVPEWLVNTPSHELKVEDCLGISNVEIRAQAVKKLGLLKLEKVGYLIEETKGDNSYKLLDMRDMFKGRYTPLLIMNNPSVPLLKHAEWVDRDCKTIRQAINWRKYGEISKKKDVEWTPYILS